MGRVSRIRKEEMASVRTLCWLGLPFSPGWIAGALGLVPGGQANEFRQSCAFDCLLPPGVSSICGTRQGRRPPGSSPVRRGFSLLLRVGWRMCPKLGPDPLDLLLCCIQDGGLPMNDTSPRAQLHTAGHVGVAQGARCQCHLFLPSVSALHVPRVLPAR